MQAVSADAFVNVQSLTEISCFSVIAAHGTKDVRKWGRSRQGRENLARVKFMLPTSFFLSVTRISWGRMPN